MLASGDIFGQTTLLTLNLLDLPSEKDVLEAIKLELEDSLFPCLEKIQIGSDP